MVNRSIYKVFCLITSLAMLLSIMPMRDALAYNQHPVAQDKLSPSAEFVLWQEDFEGSFGNGVNDWSVGDSESWNNENHYWDDVNSSFGGEGTKSGSKKAYASAAGTTVLGKNAYCDSTTSPSYRRYMTSYMEHTVDLTQMSTARVNFWYKIPALADGGSEGYFSISSPNGGSVITYNTPKTAWTEVNEDLGLYIGQVVTLKWVFANYWSTDCPTNGEAMYVDYIRVLGTSINDPVKGEITSYSDSPDPVNAGNQIGFTVSIKNTGIVTWDQWRFTIKIYKNSTTDPVLSSPVQTDTSDIGPNGSDTSILNFSVPTNWEGRYIYQVVAEAHYNSAWQQVDLEELGIFNVNGVTSMSLDGNELNPSHPSVAVGESFTVRYYINNPTAVNQTLYLIARSRTPAGAYYLLEDTSGNSAVQKTILPGSNWYERTAVVYSGAPVAAGYGLTWFISPTTSWSDNIDSADSSGAFDVVESISSVRITVQNWDGSIKPDALVSIYDSNWTRPPLWQNPSDGNGVASFTSVPPGNYNVEVTYTPAWQTPAATELWGSAPLSVLPGQPASLTITRSWPIIALNSQPALILPVNPVNTGRPAPIQIKVFAPQGGTYTARVRMILDRDKTLPYDIPEYPCTPDQQSVGSTAVSFDCTSPVIPQAGVYYVYYRIEGLASDWVPTDQNNWSASFSTSDDLIKNLYGDFIYYDIIQLFGKSYVVYHFLKPGADPDSVIALPFYYDGDPNSMPDPVQANLVLDIEEGIAVLQTAAFQRNQAGPVNLIALRDDELIPVREYYRLDKWYVDVSSYVSGPAGPLVKLFLSKRKVDRVWMSQTAFWVAGQVPSGVIEAWATGGVNLLWRIPSLIDHLYNMGKLAKVPQEEIEAIVLAQSLYTKDFDTFRAMNILSNIDSLESFVDLIGPSMVTKKWVDGSYNLSQYEAAVKLVNPEDVAKYRKAFTGNVISLAYGIASKFAEDWIFNGTLHWDSLDAEVEKAAWLHDVHSEALSITADELNKKATRIFDLWNGVDTPANRQELTQLQHNFMFQYHKIYWPLYAEFYGVHLEHLQEIRDNANPPLFAWWMGARETAINELSDYHHDLVDNVNSSRTTFANYETDYELFRYGYLGAMQALQYQESNQLLKIKPEGSSSVVIGTTAPTNLTIDNDYGASIYNITIDGITDPNVYDGILVSSASSSSIPAGQSGTISVNISAPENWFATRDPNAYNDEDEAIWITLMIHWIVNGQYYSRTFNLPVVVVAESYVTKFTADRYLFHPGELVNINLEWEALPSRGVVRAVAKWMYPDGSVNGPINWGNATNNSATIQYITPNGPFGAYGMEVFVYESTRPNGSPSGVIVIPPTELNRVFYVIPDVQGSLGLFTNPSQSAIIYSALDSDAAYDIATGLGILETNMYLIETHTEAELINIASSQDTVLIGGKQANPLVSILTQNSNLPDSLNQEGSAYIYVIDNAFSSHSAIVVAGYNMRDTQIAAVGLVDAWKPCYPLSMNYTGQGNDITALPQNSGGCPIGHYHTYETIQLTAHPATGYHVGSWIGTNNNTRTSTINTANMPAGPLTVTANYVQNTPTCYVLTLTHTGSGNDPMATPANSTDCPAGQYLAGDPISLTAYPSTGYHVGSWIGTNNNTSTSTINNTNMPAGPLTVTANYVQNTPTCYVLTLNHTGSGNDPMATPANSTGCTAGQYLAGDPISLTAYPSTGYHVGSWIGTNNNTSTSTINNTNMPAGPLTVTVNYVQDTPTCYALTLTHTGSGNDPMATPANSTGCPAGQYLAGDPIMLTASPATDYHVGSWNGTNNNNSTSTINTTNMPDGLLTVTVNYVHNTCYALTLTHTGSGDDPVATPGNSTGCPMAMYVEGTPIMLTASPATDYHVGSWSGTNNDASNLTSNTANMPAEPHTVTVNYVQVLPPQPPPAFGKVDPLNGAPNQPITLTLRWQENPPVMNYEYCYDTSDDNSCSIWIDNKTSSSSPQLCLDYNQTYYWHVRAWNSAAGPTYSDNESTAFSHFATMVAPLFEKYSPLNLIKKLTRTPTLSWSSYGCATQYEYCITTKKMKTGTANCDTGWQNIGSSTSVTLPLLLAKHKYYWQVRVLVNGVPIYANSGKWWKFKTGKY